MDSSSRPFIMSTDYNVFICHRGPDTKRNVVSVLKGMCNSDGITCFVDYEIDDGTDVNAGIKRAIESFLVHIVILSPDFIMSRWCFKEVLQIMTIQNTIFTSEQPRKVIPIYYDVEPSTDMNLATLTDYGSVFICHNKMDTQRNAVSVLRRILGSRGITCSVVDYGKERAQMKLDIDNAIRNSTVHEIFLSESFVKSKQCLEEVVKIMDLCKESTQVKMLPVFYDVVPTLVRYQKKGSTYDLDNVHDSTHEERECWAEALKGLSNFKGLEYNTKTMFQWKTLDEIARKVEAFLNKEAISDNNKQKGENLYQEKFNEVLKMIISEDNSKDVNFVGVYDRNDSTFVELMVQKFHSQFDTFCFISDVKVEGSNPERLVLYSDLIRKPNQEPLSLHDLIKYRSHYEQLLRNKRCLVGFDKLGNDIDNLKALLDLVKANLRHRKPCDSHQSIPTRFKGGGET